MKTMPFHTLIACLKVRFPARVATAEEKKGGFTLLEVSVVLVIIGLLVGGLLVGKDLIRAAELRGQIKQITDFQLAVKAFRLKYNQLPGDMQAQQAAAVGFTYRTGTQTDGDNNGCLQGLNGGTPYGSDVLGSEQALFWRDLSDAGLIRQNFHTAQSASLTPMMDTTDWKLLVPTAALADNLAVYAWCGVVSYGMASPNYQIGPNYFGISNIRSRLIFGAIDSIGGLMPYDVYSMDSKIDDGLPFTGNVIDTYAYFNSMWPTNWPSCYLGPATQNKYDLKNTSPTCGIAFKFE